MEWDCDHFNHLRHCPLRYILQLKTDYILLITLYIINYDYTIINIRLYTVLMSTLYIALITLYIITLGHYILFAPIIIMIVD